MSRRLIAAMLPLILAGCTASQPAAPPPHIASPTDPLSLTEQERTKIGLSTDKVIVRTLPVLIEATGTVRANPNLTTPVISLVPGRVEEVKVQHGDQVKKDQELASIRSDEVGQIEAEMLTRMLELQSEKRQAALKIALAQKVYDRQKRLMDERIAARADFEQAESELQQANALASAAEEKEQALVISTKERLQLFGISAELVDRVLQNRTIELLFDISAPRDGIVTQRDADPGELVESAKPLFSISDLSKVWLVANVLESDERFMRKGLKVKVYVDSLPGESFPGVLDYIDSHIDSQTRTLAVRATIDNPHLRLKPGMFTRLSVTVDTATSLMVPEAAVQKVGETYLVYLAGENHQYRERKVKTGRNIGGYVEILSGLHPKDNVVVQGSLQLLGQSLERLSQ